MSVIESFLNNLKNRGVLREMSVACSKKDGFGIVIIVYSNDHEPAHAHIFDLNKKERCQILITDEVPKTTADIHVYKGNSTEHEKRTIVEWAKTKGTFGEPNWLFLKALWDKRLTNAFED